LPFSCCRRQMLLGDSRRRRPLPGQLPARRGYHSIRLVCCSLHMCLFSFPCRRGNAGARGSLHFSSAYGRVPTIYSRFLSRFLASAGFLVRSLLLGDNLFSSERASVAYSSERVHTLSIMFPLYLFRVFCNVYGLYGRCCAAHPVCVLKGGWGLLRWSFPSILSRGVHTTRGQPFSKEVRGFGVHFCSTTMMKLRCRRQVHVYGIRAIVLVVPGRVVRCSADRHAMVMFPFGIRPAKVTSWFLQRACVVRYVMFLHNFIFETRDSTVEVCRSGTP